MPTIAKQDLYGPFLKEALVTSFLFGVLWLMVSGLVVSREQETAPESLTNRTASREQENGAGRGIAMKVAVANSMLGQGQTRSALGLYKEAIEEGRVESEQVTALAAEISGEKNWSPKKLLFGDFSKEQKKEIVEGLLQEGNAYLDQGDYDRAVDSFEKIFLLEPLNRKASRGIDKARRRLIEDKQAEKEARAAEYGEEDRETVQMELNRASGALKEGSRSRAKMHIDRVLLIDPDNSEAKRLFRGLGGEA